MPYYLTIPKEPLTIQAPDGSVAAQISASDVIKALFTDARLSQSMDVCDRYDLRKKLLEADGVAVLSESEFEAWKPIVTRTSALSPAALDSPDVVDFLRAMKNAPTTEPVAPKAT